MNDSGFSGAMRVLALPTFILIMAGCAVIVSEEWDERYGSSEVRDRSVSLESVAGINFEDNVKPVLEQRCIVCHGCYDAPCQLKLSSPSGIDRGANPAKVYSGSRLKEATPSRLFIDHQTTEGWRTADFYPVLNEGRQDPATNIEAGVMARLLELKQVHPLPDQSLLPDSFDLGLNRAQQCPRAEDMDDFERKYPLWGMPYALPALSQEEHATLMEWLEQGAPMPAQLPPDPVAQQQIDAWEAFLNGDSDKQRLAARYLYEHWFLAHLYFSDLEAGAFYRLVRSETPPGQPIKVVATRRPYDDPGVSRVYYRFWAEQATVIDTPHLPSALNDARLDDYRRWFMETDYQVASLPGYAPEITANPFKVFGAIPVEVRYRFLLEEAQFTIMNFIKGPVCRGQIALNVIQDHFWVFFVSPESQVYTETDAFYNDKENLLSLPSEAGSDAPTLRTWFRYSRLQRDYMQAKATAMNAAFPGGRHLTLDTVWDGDRANPNAALTVMRHFDSATVVQGLLGPPPLTAWLVDYGLLERIHYLLVAGYDVYGNIGHQLNSRLYMDFLRMEGEFNFLSLLPAETRIVEIKDWYQGVSKRELEHLLLPFSLFTQPSGISYSSPNPKQALFEMLERRLAPVLGDDFQLGAPDVPALQRAALARLEQLVGEPATLMPQITILTVSGTGGDEYYTLLPNHRRRSVTNFLDEDKTRMPQLDTLMVARGVLGSYPGAFMKVDENQLDDFVGELSAMRSEDDYSRLMDRYGIRRTSAEFWPHSDQVQRDYRNSNQYLTGLLDYNRLENR